MLVLRYPGRDGQGDTGPGNAHRRLRRREALLLYPFDHEFEGILRGLRYIPAYLARAWEQPEFARSVGQTAGGCLEGCVKDMVRAGPKRHVYGQKPLDGLARTAHAKRTLGAELADAIAIEIIRTTGAKVRVVLEDVGLMEAREAAE